MNTADKIKRAWPIIKWLDDARWDIGASSSVIPGAVFASLSSQDKILTHWLCYITNQQRKAEQVWEIGGPVFSELVLQYRGIANAQETLELLCRFTTSNGIGKIDTFESKNQTVAGEVMKYRPRYGTHMLSIARTLNLLAGFENSLSVYLTKNSSFIFGHSSNQDDSPTLRTAFLLSLLSYERIYSGMTSYHIQKQDFISDLQKNQSWMNQKIHSSLELENYYLGWVEKRFIKRLWAAFRDYVKPGSYLEPIFIESLRLAGAQQLVDLLNHNRKSILQSLEVPGDLWNLRFFDRIFGGKITNADIRYYWKELTRTKQLDEQFYPEQFDVSFDFAQKMCQSKLEQICPFRNGMQLQKLCFGDLGKGKTCPVLNSLCGYNRQCFPIGCPVKQGLFENICIGC